MRRAQTIHIELLHAFYKSFFLVLVLLVVYFNHNAYAEASAKAQSASYFYFVNASLEEKTD